MPFFLKFHVGSVTNSEVDQCMIDLIVYELMAQPK
ncbi:hypothetical protein DT23_18945 [Thioclava indica]|uniref:Uncharacterized protein n=1 Tax=Thioclava indica TaxID=1353528 RepID=A0A074J4I6_9RHOB|nr:hypothetical protein DT23_18945 [Thioclava indica]